MIKLVVKDFEAEVTGVNFAVYAAFPDEAKVVPAMDEWKSTVSILRRLVISEENIYRILNSFAETFKWSVIYPEIEMDLFIEEFEELKFISEELFLKFAEVTMEQVDIQISALDRLIEAEFCEYRRFEEAEEDIRNEIERNR